MSPRPAPSGAASSAAAACWITRAPREYPTSVKRRNLNLKAKVESGSSYFSFRCLVPGAFNMGLIGSTCTALPV